MSELNFVHRFVAAPSGMPNRVLLLLHGTGGDESDLIPLGRSLDPNAALLSPRGKVLENGMPRFFRRLAEGVFDEEDVIRRTHELADFVAGAAARYGFDIGSVIGVGYSNGANIAAAVLLLRSEALAAAILFRAMVPLVPSGEPNLSGKRVLICAGEKDPIIPLQNAEHLTIMLRNAGADVTLHLELAGHGLTTGDVEAAKAWLQNGK